MRPERRDHEAGLEEEDLAGSHRVHSAHWTFSRRSVESLHGRLHGQCLRTGKDGHAFWSWPLPSSSGGRMPRHVLLAVAGLALVLLLLAGVPLSAQGSPGVAVVVANSCAYLRLKSAPDWVVSGAWRGGA